MHPIIVGPPPNRPDQTYPKVKVSSTTATSGLKCVSLTNRFQKAFGVPGQLRGIQFNQYRGLYTGTGEVRPVYLCEIELDVGVMLV